MGYHKYICAIPVQNQLITGWKPLVILPDLTPK